MIIMTGNKMLGIVVVLSVVMPVAATPAQECELTTNSRFEYQAPGSTETVILRCSLYCPPYAITDVSLQFCYANCKEYFECLLASASNGEQVLSWLRQPTSTVDSFMFHPTISYVSCNHTCRQQRAVQFCSDNCPGYASKHRSIRPTGISHSVTNDYSSNIREHDLTSNNGLTSGPTDISQASTADAVDGWATTNHNVSLNLSLPTRMLVIVVVSFCVVVPILLTALFVLFVWTRRWKLLKPNDAHPAGPAHESEHINQQGQAIADLENPEEADPMLPSPSTDFEQQVIEPGQPKMQEKKLENNVDGQLCNETNCQYRSDHNQHLQSRRQPLTDDQHPGEPTPPMPDGSGQFDLHSSVDTRGHPEAVDSVRHSDLEMIGVTPRPSQHPISHTNSLNHSSCGADDENYSANMQFVVSNV
jgi:hypothetical protein